MLKRLEIIELTTSAEVKVQQKKKIPRLITSSYTKPGPHQNLQKEFLNKTTVSLNNIWPIKFTTIEKAQ